MQEEVLGKLLTAYLVHEPPDPKHFKKSKCANGMFEGLVVGDSDEKRVPPQSSMRSDLHISGLDTQELPCLAS